MPVIVITALFIGLAQQGFGESPVEDMRAKVVAEAQALLEEYQVSYAYGGNRVGTAAECATCNQCLGRHKPKPKQRFKTCPECYSCSLDCSHFTNLVFKNSGLKSSYLTTKTMLDLDKRRLNKTYRLIDMGRDLGKAAPGDLLVYRGHVVILASSPAAGRGDVVHATGGKDIREPGQGIQRERRVPLATFRGPLLRILRHRALLTSPNNKRLRPLRK